MLITFSLGLPFACLLQFSALYGAATKWVLKEGTETELKAKEKTLQSALVVAENLKKELSEKAEENNQNEARVRELEKKEKQLLEENRLVAENRDYKVAELT